MNIKRAHTTKNSLYQALRNKVLNKLNLPVHLNHEGKYRGNVLISYLKKSLTVAPYEQWSTLHSSEWECFEIARLFREKGYRVDMINWDDESFIPKKNYAYVLDTQRNLERLSKHISDDTVLVHYIVSSHWQFQNDAELKRIIDINKRRNAHLSTHREEKKNNNIEIADVVVGLGNETTKKTYSFAKKEIHSIPISSTIEFQSLPTKNWDEARKKFLWFGGGGAALKGLDIVLEVFKDRPDLDLTVCGPVEKEADFVEIYRRELYESPNIHYLGRINPLSEQFEKISQSQGFLLYPSASEGQSGAVVTCLHAGLIPIVSENSGVDIDDIGFELNTCTIDEVSDTIKIASKGDITVLEKLSEKAFIFAKNRFTTNSFSKAFSNFMETLIDRTYNK